MDVKVTAASASDLQGAKKMLEPLADLFPRMSLLWGESHYGGTLIQWLDEYFGWKVEIVHGLGTIPDASTQACESERQKPKGSFKVLPRRWVIERSIAWITCWRRRMSDHEGLPQSSEAFIKLSASRRMLSHIALAAT